MTRIYDKINLPTNTTDIRMFAKYLKAVEEKGIVSKEEEQALFAQIKISESRKDVQTPKRDTHTKQTLSLFGLVDIIDDGSFSVSELGKELVRFYESPESHTEEERVALMLKVFMRWHIEDESFNRNMHPGYLTIKLLCDADLGYYFTNQEYADFVTCDKYVSDEQYEEIKKHILKFREGKGISKHVAQSKVGIFLASLVSSWGILNASQDQLNAEQTKVADKYFKEYMKSDESRAEGEDAEVSDVEETISVDITNLTAAQKNAHRAFHVIKRYRLDGLASYISQVFLHLQEGCEVKEYNKYLTTESIFSNQSGRGLGLQVIYYGAPGTGKSYFIKKNMIPDKVVPYRVTFYPDYYYSDFVGGLRPRNDAGGIDYRFEPGPFAEALKDSFSKPTYLIIEEINRGNAAAIFGDIFQLLDRKGGRSEYSITNKELYGYLVREGVQVPETNKVFLPSNLNILCTMNTADQNVFVLDTAFKRRFKMVYVPIDFNAYFVNGNPGEKVKEECKDYIEKKEIFEGEDYEGNLEVVMTTELHWAVKKVIGEPCRDWRTFAAYVNAKIDSINSIEPKISEDKKLGPFFVSPDELKSRQAFVDKVIYYLKQDVFKYEDNILVDSYEALYDGFVVEKKDLFELFQNPR